MQKNDTNFKNLFYFFEIMVGNSVWLAQQPAILVLISVCFYLSWIAETWRIWDVWFRF